VLETPRDFATVGIEAGGVEKFHDDLQCRGNFFKPLQNEIYLNKIILTQLKVFKQV